MSEINEQSMMARAEEACARGELRRAAQMLERVVEANPSNAAARHRFAVLLGRLGRRARALEEMRPALEAESGIAVWHFDLGEILEALQRLEEAAEAFRRAEELDPSEARYPGRLAMLLRRLRDDVGARAAAERALAMDPGQPRALLSLSQDALRDGRLDDADGYAARVIEGGRAAQFRATAWHLRGRVLEARERWDEAFDAHIAGNELKLGIDRVQRALKNRISGFRPQLRYASSYGRWGAERHADGIAAPVVVAGFPRSGTTMVEQILAAHPGLATCEERPLFDPIRAELARIAKEREVHGATGDPLEGLTEEEILRLRGIYRSALEGAASEGAGDRVLIDKHPLRTLDLGLMNRLFPEARVIFMVRDPRDVCVSALFQDFVANPAMVRFLTPELCVDFYEHVMGFWLELRGMLTLEVLEVRYEDLVGDFETWGRRLVEHCGVEWDERVRDFHEPAGRRAVRTASYEAVTEPLHGRAIGRWKHYSEKLAPILGRLEPFVEAFGYEAGGAASVG